MASVIATGNAGRSGAGLRRLSGDWHLATDPENKGREEGWFKAIRLDAQPAPVPGCIQEVFPRYHGVAWYWRDMEVPENPHPEGPTLLRFWAVDYLAEVWVNGIPVGGHEGGETPFLLDVSDAVKPGKKNLLAARVLNPTHEGIDGIALAETPHSCKNYPLEIGKWCFLNAGGIVDDVELICSPALRISDVYLRPNWKTGDVRIEVAVRSFRKTPTKSVLQLSMSPAAGGSPADAASIAFDANPGPSTVKATLHVENHRLWDISDPYLYRMSARVFASERPDAFDEVLDRCGFRDFRFADGHFRLNGKRVFLRGAHTVNEFPAGIVVPRDPQLAVLDIVHAKAVGLNCIRFISMMPPRLQRDLCDELGMMIYEENMASWRLEDSPRMAEHYDRSFQEMILRDRNHPSVVMWGMLNETGGQDPVYLHARDSLALVRSLDPDRLVLLNSGSFDLNIGTGCMSNPGSDEWDVYLGSRAPGKGTVDWNPDSDLSNMIDPLAGDIHCYPPAPQPLKAVRALRRVGEGIGPMFLSEYGQGSAIDLSRLAFQCEQAGAGQSEAAEVFAAERALFMRDWSKWGMAEIFGRPEDYFHQAQARMANLRYEGINALRANPNMTGYSMTSLRDVGHSGEGLWTFFRELKPGAADALCDAYAPLRWCLFAEPDVIYSGRKIHLEAVLANEDVLKPGEYPVRLEIFGPSQQRVWRKRATVRIPTGRERLPFAIPVFSGDVRIDGPAGRYRLAASMEKGGAPLGRPATFYVDEESVLPRVNAEVVVWGKHAGMKKWLKSRGIRVRPFPKKQSRRELILVTDKAAAPGNAHAFAELCRHVARGSTAIFLSPEVFRHRSLEAAWLPMAEKESLCKVPSDLYIADNWAKAHPAFAGLPAGGLLDDSFYRELIPVKAWNGSKGFEEAIAGASRCAMHPGTGYVSGLFLSSHRLGAGRMFLNTFRILENLDTHPAADRLLLNLIAYAGEDLKGRMRALPKDFDRWLSRTYPPVVATVAKHGWQVSADPDPEILIQDVEMPEEEGRTWREHSTKALVQAAHTASDADAGFVSFYVLDGDRGGIMYARGEIVAPVDMTCNLLVGTDGPLKVWLDGQVVGVVLSAGNPAVPDKFAFPVELRMGRHRVVVAHHRRGGKAWGFFFRMQRTGKKFTEGELRSGLAVEPVLDPQKHAVKETR